MTERRRWPGVRPAVVAAAALALAGCAATHVGDDWQCPLAQGEVCASVAAADPAVLETGDGGDLAVAEPLYARAGAPHASGTEAAAADERDCGTGCGPLAWLRGLFDGLAGDAGSGEGEGAAAGPPGDGEAAGTARVNLEVPSPAAQRPETQVQAMAAGHEGEAAETAPLPATEAPSGADLRAPEVIGRVWIAPFVDAEGIYREGAWVRVVIAPAEWRLR